MLSKRVLIVLFLLISALFADYVKIWDHANSSQDDANNNMRVSYRYPPTEKGWNEYHNEISFAYQVHYYVNYNWLDDKDRTITYICGVYEDDGIFVDDLIGTTNEITINAPGLGAYTAGLHYYIGPNGWVACETEDGPPVASSNNNTMTLSKLGYFEFTWTAPSVDHFSFKRLGAEFYAQVTIDDTDAGKEAFNGDNHFNNKFKYLKPKIEITLPNNSSSCNVGDQLPIKWTSEHLRRNVSVGYSYNNGSFQSIATNIPNSGTHIWNTSGLTPGSYQIKVANTDAVSNKDYSDISDVFTLKLTNKKPTVSIVSGPSGNTDDQTPQFIYAGSDDIGIEKFYVSIDDPTPNQSTSATSFTATKLSYGSHTFYVQAEDKLGLKSDVVSRKFNVVKKKYSISAAVNGGGTIIPSGTFTKEEGDNQTFTISPNSGWSIKEILVNGVSVGAKETHSLTNIEKNYNIVANFSRIIHEINATASEGGTISPSGKFSVNDGDNQTFSITPQSGWKISGIYLDGVAQVISSLFNLKTIKKNHTVSATFSRIVHLITFSTSLGGTISPNGTLSVNEGDDQAFTVTPEDGWEINDVIVDGSSVGNAQTHILRNVNKNITVYASFSQRTHQITASAGEGGIISPSGVSTVNDGESKTYAIIPNTNWKIVNVFVNGNNVGAVGSYTITNIKEDQIITASFAPITCKVTVNTPINGHITPSGSFDVDFGEDVEFTILPESGYQVIDFIVNGESKGPVTSHICRNVDKDISINAEFDVATGILDYKSSVIKKLGTYPNPVTSTDDVVTFLLNLTDDHQAKLVIFDAVGNEIRKDIFEGNTQLYQWDLTNSYGIRVSSGSYVVLLEVHNSDGTKTYAKSTIGIQTN